MRMKFYLMWVLVIVILVSGCGTGNVETQNGLQSTEESHTETDKWDAYITSIKSQSDDIKNSLENDELTQTDMNIKSEELNKLWDDALNYLWGELKNSLSEGEFSKLLEEQRIWIAEKEKSVEEAGKEFKGGSIYPLVVNIEAAKITEERVHEFIELLR